MQVELPPKSHVDTPAWQSFEMRMRARALERRAARRRRRRRRIRYVAGGLFALLLGVLSAFVWREIREPAIREQAVAIEAATAVEWPPRPEPPPAVQAAGIRSLSLPANWNVPWDTDAASAEAELRPEEESAPQTALTTVPAPVAVPEEESAPQTALTTVPAPVAVKAEAPARQPRAPTARPEPRASRSETLAASSAASPRTLDLRPVSSPLTTSGTSATATRPAEPDRQNQPSEPIGSTNEQNQPAEPTGRIDRPNQLAEPVVGTTGRNLPSEPPVGTVRRNPLSEPVAAADPREPVRKVLERYRSAYQQLDASAARAVWPAVDGGALARAFSSLNSQELWFDGCRINVSGSTADATCTGHSRVVPKIGGGSETARRTWQFKLRQNGNDWIIDKATVK